MNTPRPYIVPTGLGFSYGLLVFILVIISVNNRNNLLFLFAFFLFSVGVVTMMMTHRNFEKIKFNFLQASLMFKNEPGFLTYKMENSGRKDSYMISVAEKTIEHIKASEKKDIQISFTPLSYGVISTPIQKLESLFPLQFLRVWRFLQPEVKITIFPEKINYFSLESHQSERESGFKNVQAQESSEKEISHFDQYQETDSPQHINWKMLAKMNDLYVNKFESQVRDQKQIVILWKDTEVLNDIEKRKSQFAYWIDYAYKQKKTFMVQFEEQQILVASFDQKNLMKALRLLL